MGTEKGLEEYIAAYGPGKPIARSVPLTRGDDIIWVIFYEHTDPTNEVFRRAHEETHVLHGIGQIHLLQRKLAERGLNINLGRYKDFDAHSGDENEIVANIGALYALEKNGAKISQVVMETYMPGFQDARRLYLKAIRDAWGWKDFRTFI